MDIGSLIIGFILGVIGSFFGAWFSFLFSIYRTRKEEFNKAATSFTTAFLPELIFLKHNAKVTGAASHTDLNDFLFSGYLRHLEALTIFLNYLSEKEIRGINEAWQAYCYHPNNPNYPYFEQYSWKVANKGKDYEKQLKLKALDRIENILKFAKSK